MVRTASLTRSAVRAPIGEPPQGPHPPSSVRSNPCRPPLQALAVEGDIAFQHRPGIHARLVKAHRNKGV